MPKINVEQTIYIPFRCPISLFKQIEEKEPDWSSHGKKSEILVKVLKEKYYSPTNYDERILKIQDEIKTKADQIKNIEAEIELMSATISALKDNKDKTKKDARK